jgi:hypothetical protein
MRGKEAMARSIVERADRIGRASGLTFAAAGKAPANDGV